VNLKPLGNRVLIKPEGPPTQTESGLVLVEHWKPEQMGVVVSLGPAVTGICQVGNTVLFSWSAGQELFDHDDDQRYLLLREDDLIAVLEEA
jgi:chaperonin GroES